MVFYHQILTQIWKVNMTHEEFKLYVYNQYDCLHGVFKNLPDKCYEIINDRQKSAHTNRGYSRYEHHYKIKW